MSSTHARSAQCSQPVLPGSIPQLQTDKGAGLFDSSQLEINTDSGEEAVPEVALSVSEKEAGLADPRIAH